MLRILNKWDTFVIFILLFSLIGGTTSAVKSFADLNKVQTYQSPFYRELVDKTIYETKINPTILPNFALVSVGNKQFYDSNGSSVPNISPEMQTQSNAPFVYSELNKYDPSRPPRLAEIVPTPIKPEKFNYLYYPRFDVSANIVYSQKNDFDIIDDGKPCSQKSIATPIQKLVKLGIVHIYGSPLPGEVRYPQDPVEYYGKDEKGIPQLGTGIGSSYIIGHSSECTQHAYTRIFAPLERASRPGEEFFIYDQVGRKLKFKVFESLEINDRDTKEAYKLFPNRRVVTLQTSIYYNPFKIHRWLTRGELVLE